MSTKMASLLPNPLLHPLVPWQNMHDCVLFPSRGPRPGTAGHERLKGAVLFRRSWKTYTNNSSEQAPQGRSFPLRRSSFLPTCSWEETGYRTWGREGLLLTAPESASRRSKDSAATWQTSWGCWLLAIVNQLWGSRWPLWMWKLHAASCLCAGVSLLGRAWASPTLVWLHSASVCVIYACLLAWTDHLPIK